MLREEEVAGTCKLLVLRGPRGPGPKASLAGQGALLPEASVPRSRAPRCQAPPLPAKGWWWKRAELSQHQAGGWRKGPHPCLVRVGRESSPEPGRGAGLRGEPWAHRHPGLGGRSGDPSPDPLHRAGGQDGC